MITTSDKKEVAEKLNNYFIDAVDNLDIESYLPENVNDLLTEFIPVYKKMKTPLNLRTQIKDANSKFKYKKGYISQDK